MTKRKEETKLCSVCKRVPAHPLYNGKCENCWAFRLPPKRTSSDSQTRAYNTEQYHHPAGVQ